jgi:hypothetical protein
VAPIGCLGDTTLIDDAKYSQLGYCHLHTSGIVYPYSVTQGGGVRLLQQALGIEAQHTPAGSTKQTHVLLSPMVLDGPGYCKEFRL